MIIYPKHGHKNFIGFIFNLRSGNVPILTHDDMLVLLHDRSLLRSKVCGGDKKNRYLIDQIDPFRGQAYLLFSKPFEEWHEFIANYFINKNLSRTTATV
ncbi:hypothetical protein TW74_13815 [Vibrio nigripulchritudo]|nr:hypothetical protein TW74_13815 [Vibrio nigripulchritudo]